MTGQGLFGPELGVKQLEILAQAVPSAQRIAILWQPEYEPASTADEFDAAFAAMDKEHAEAVVALASSLTYSHRARLADLAREHRLPFMAGEQRAGGLLSYGANINAIYRQCAGYVDKILKGAKPSDLPVQLPTKIDLIVDLKIAKTLGITIPPSILARADEVIE